LIENHARDAPHFKGRIDCGMNLELGKLAVENVDRTDGTPADLSAQPDGNQTEWPEKPLGFKVKDFVVYPAHGVGQILTIEVQTFAGASLEFFVIYFAPSKMKLRVPTGKAASVGMRKPSSPATIEQARRILSEVPTRKRANWARSIKEYESKIKSGDIIAIAEVVRDLCRRSAESEQSYSERQLYTMALDRMCEEVALVEGLTEEKAAQEIENLLMNRPDRTRRAKSNG
jgi:CarD family transcriptional regulator